MSGGVAVVGSFNVDHVWVSEALPRPGETRAGRYHAGPGGKGFNQAIAAARAGAHTTFVCALGDDAGGELARTLAAADGLDLQAAASTEPTGTAGIFVDADGRNSIVIGAGANASLAAAFVQAASIGEAAVVLTQRETPADAAQVAFERAQAVGALTQLNPAPANARIPDALWALTAIATPNETEFAAHLARLGVAVDADAVASMDEAALHAHCRRLLPHGSVVVTLGAAGVFVSHADDRRFGDTATHYRVDAAPVTPVDTTGAGDAFNGALAASLATAPARPFREHVVFAVRYAGLSTEREGAALAMPNRDAVLARFPG